LATWLNRPVIPRWALANLNQLHIGRDVHQFIRGGGRAASLLAIYADDNDLLELQAHCVKLVMSGLTVWSRMCDCEHKCGASDGRAPCMATCNGWHGGTAPTRSVQRAGFAKMAHSSLNARPPLS
jgi:hypothetical protein